jgi:HAD superfamily hydrolase (TIGR01509 family)
MSNSIEAIIWDLDGVIIDSADEHRRAWQRLAREEGVTFSDADFWATFGKRNDAIFAEKWPPLSPQDMRRLANLKETYYRELIRETGAALPGALELMSQLHQAGYPQALASSAPIENIELVSEVLGLKCYLTVLISGETVPHGKPAPDIFIKAASDLGIAARSCLVIEDAVAGVEAAHAAGMRCLAVAGDRDLPGLRKAELMVKSLLQVSPSQIKALA